MADVFISYKREEIAQARRVASALTCEGYSVFFDAHDESGIHAGEAWDVRLERELGVARAVVVLWSPASVASDNVRDEARRAAARGILLPVKLEPCTTPLGLGTLQEIRLENWSGDRDDPSWRGLIDRGVSRLINRAPSVRARSDVSPSLWRSDSEVAVRLTLRRHKGPVHNAVFCPRGALIATAGEDCMARIWDAQTGRLRQELDGHGNPLWSVAFSPDGLSVLTAGGDGIVNVWDVNTGERRMLEGNISSIRRVVFSPDGHQVAAAEGAASTSVAQIWDFASGSVVHRLRGHEHDVRDVAFSTCGNLLLTASLDKTVRWWDRATGELLRTRQVSDYAVEFVTPSPDGACFLTGGFDGVVTVWDAAIGQRLYELATFGEPVTGASFSSDGRYVVISRYGGLAAVCAFSEDDDDLVMLGNDGRFLESAAFSPDARRIVSGCKDATAVVWEVGV